MRRLVLVLVLIAGSCAAQTLSPLNAEFGKKIHGQFSLTNDSFSPMNVTVEVMSMALAHNQLAPVPLIASTHIRLSDWSARIPAKQTHVFYYDGVCDVHPCVFIILSTMMVGHTNTGVAVAAHLGTVAYSCSVARDCRKSILDQLKDIK